MEETIRHQAFHDELTGLPNRRFFMDIVDLELARSKRSREKCAVLFLDLDKFKYINDSLGHSVGDKLLAEVARRLKLSMRASDTVARMGGDEFNILLSGVAPGESIISTARKILGSFRRPCLINGHAIDAGVSIGISIYPDDARDREGLFKKADIAMYHAKEAGGRTYRFYNPSMNIRALERTRLESGLGQSLDRGELEIRYQPQVNSSTRRVVCAEALVRWRHPEQGLLRPGDFIPLAEETGYITTIDEWVLRTACMQLKEWQKSGQQGICMSVNISGQEFGRPDFVERVERNSERNRT